MIEPRTKSTVQNILTSNGRALIVAMDHAKDWGPIQGLENPGVTLENVVEAGADSIMTSYGVSKLYGHYIKRQKDKVGLVVRVDGLTSIYGESWLEYTKWQQIYTVEEAVRVGADAVVVNYFMGAPAESDTIRVMSRVAVEADRLGVPLVVEALPCPNPNIPDTKDAEKMAMAGRIAVEHGADIVKSYYTGSVEGFKHVVESIPVPVLIAGGPKTDTVLEALQMVADSVEAGGRGVFYGRNIWQSPNMSGFTEALKAIIHENMPAAEAEEKFMKVAEPS